MNLLKKPSLMLFLPLIAVFFLMTTTAGAAPPPSPTLVATPNPVDFGAQDIHGGFGTQLQVEFDNTSGGNITGTGSDAITGPDAADFAITYDGCDTTLVPDGSSCILTVSFSPSAVATEQATLTVNTDAGPTTVPLTGSGATGTLTGVAPGFTPLPYNYGTNVQSVGFTNNSSYIVNPGNAVITGTDAADFAVNYNGCNFLVYPNSVCYVTVTFQAGSPGTYHAQLELTNDGTVTPIVVPLEATALSGPHIVVSPQRYDFGNVALNTSSPKQTFTISNTGDYPAGFPQLLALGGDPDAFPITNDSCSDTVLNPGTSCSFQVSYHPVNPGMSNLSVYLFNGYIFAGVGGPTIIPLQGTGVAAPNGSVSISGTPQVTKTLGCTPGGFPQGTTFSYQWNRNGKPIKGAVSAKYVLGQDDNGHKVSCVLKASNPVGNQKLTSTPVKVSSLDLSTQSGSLVNQHLTRSAKISGLLKTAGKPVRVSKSDTVDGTAPLVLQSSTKMVVKIDGVVVGKGKTVNLSPRALSQFDNGMHVISVVANGLVSNAQLKLATTPLVAQLKGNAQQGGVLTVSSLYQLNSVKILFPKSLTLDTGVDALGSFSFQSAVVPAQSFLLDGSGVYNGVKVVLSAHSIEITNLPAQTGQIRFRLAPGVLIGNGTFKTVISTPASARVSVSSQA